MDTHQIPSIGGDKLINLEGWCIFFSLTRKTRWLSVRETSGETQQRLTWTKLKVGILDVISRGLSNHLLFMPLQLFFFLSPSLLVSILTCKHPFQHLWTRLWHDLRHSKFSARKHIHLCSRKKKKLWIDSSGKLDKISMNLLPAWPEMHFSGLQRSVLKGSKVRLHFSASQKMTPTSVLSWKEWTSGNSVSVDVAV